MDRFDIPSPEAQEALPKRRSSCVTCVTEESQASLAVATDTEVPDNENENWDLEDAVVLKDMDRIGACRRLRDFQDSCHAKKSKIPGIVAEAIELAT